MIEWRDSAHISPGAWVDGDHVDEIEPCQVLSVGWLVSRDRSRLVLAQSISESGDLCGVFVIPAAMVVRLRRLRRHRR